MKLMKSQKVKSISCTVDRLNFNRQRLLSLEDADLIWGGGWCLFVFVWLGFLLFLFLIHLAVVKNMGDD